MYPALKRISRHLLPALLVLPVLTACKSSSINEAVVVSCPQDRHTELAPAKIASMANPLAGDEDAVTAGRRLYEKDARPVACAECHGPAGEGNGPMAHMFEPSPRNFSCAATMDTIADGQLFWIIRNGSIGTSMPAFDKLSDQQIWQLVTYIRRISRQSTDT